jgi:hypothetical protein
MLLFHTENKRKKGLATTMTINEKSNWDLIGEENRKQNEFVEAYILKYFGERPADPEVAYSKAITAYWELLGYKFGGDEETFILPKSN